MVRSGFFRNLKRTHKPKDTIMLDDSDRFAFTPTRIYAFETSGDAYDATQTDERIANGDILLILTEKIVGIAYTWPYAITANCGRLHAIDPKPGETLEELAGQFATTPEQLCFAIDLADALCFKLCPATRPHFGTAPSTT